jgi:hypothetical protein
VETGVGGRLIVEKNSNRVGRGCSVAGCEYPIAKLTVLQREQEDNISSSHPVEERMAAQVGLNNY